MKNSMPAKGWSASGGKKLITALLAGLTSASIPLFAFAAVLSTPLTVGTSFPSLGGATNISGSCGNTGANSTVSFALLQNGTSTALSGSNLNTDSAGSFSGNVTFPQVFPSGSATLVATCALSGDTINSSTVTFPAATSTSFNLGMTPNAGGVVALNGACGASGGGGTATLSLTMNGSTTQLGSSNLSSTGTFSGNFLVPSNVSAGAGTLTATCSNGTTFSSNVTINPSPLASLQTNASAVLGGTTNVSGNCGTNGTNASGTTSFSVFRNGSLTPLTASGGSNVSGAFNSSVTLPSGLGSGPVTLVVTCPSGSTFTTALSLVDPAGGLTVPPGTTPTPTPDVGGVAAGQTPVGGVAAGKSATETPVLLYVLLAAAGLSAFAAIKKLKRS